MSEKLRLDTLLVERGLVAGRELAKSLIMEGKVLVEGERVDKAGHLVRADAALTLTGAEKKFVSRGGYKLEKALDTFGLSVSDRVCIDAGASTGGFTDCMLQRGARLVYAVDVGYGQLAWELRTNPNVVCLERTNVRHLTEAHIQDKADLITIDLSFISLRLVLPALSKLLAPGGHIVALVKPQFEAGREKVGKKGVVRDADVHVEVLDQVMQSAAAIGLTPAGLTHSPIKGPEGNIEFLLLLSTEDSHGSQPDAHAAVLDAHSQLAAKPAKEDAP